MSNSRLGRLQVWLRRHFKAIAIIVSPLALWLINSFVDYLTADWLSRTVWSPLSEVSRAWAKRPIGYVGLVALLWAVVAGFVVGALAFADRSRTVAWFRDRVGKKKAAKPTKLDPDDRPVVASVRAVWYTAAQTAAMSLDSLANGALFRLDDRDWPFVDYFRRTKTAAQQAGEALVAALDKDAERSLADVQAAFELWVQSYRRLIRETAWLAAGEADALLGNERDIVRWRGTHVVLEVKLAELCVGWPEHETLKVFFGPHLFAFDRATADFVRGPLPPSA